MKKIILPAIVLGCGLLFLNAGNKSDGQPVPNKKQFIQKLVITTLSNSHYQPVAIDDDFSEKAFKEYLSSVDYNKLFLHEEDVDELDQYEYSLDDHVNLGKLDLYENLNKILDKRTEEARKIYTKILSKPFDFSIKEELETDAEKLEWVGNKNEWENRWRKRLKGSVLSRLEKKHRNQEKKLEDNPDYEAKSFEEMEKDAREKVLKNQDNWFDRLEKLSDEDKFEMYINSMVSVFDPHSAYLAPKTKKNFDIAISGQLEGIGARLSQSDGEIKISEIIPGSPCDIQGDLEVEDIILKAAEKGEEATDLSDMLLDEAVQYIRGKKGTTVTLTVKKIDGTNQEIPIVRDVVVNRETYAKSALIDKDGKKFGYIKLPKFYADFTGKNGRNSSSDMEKEVKKLKSENVEGILIDLRGNGGGSLRDVVDIAGLFIEKGPIVQVKAPQGRNRVYRDSDSRVQYDGPLVIMVDKFSASASEILAAAMQDYGRAVIIGSEHTFGKGTVQNFFNFDRSLSGKYAEFKPMGSLKLTIQKFYRVNGGSTQLKGVESDIVLPDNYSYIELGEGERDFALEWDKINPATYSSLEGELPINEVRKNSMQRVKENTAFNIIDKNAKDMKERRDDSKVSLSWDAYLAEQEDIKAKNKALKESKKNLEKLEVLNMEVDMAAINEDSTFIKLNNKWLASLEKDIYLEEAVEVILDMN